MCVCVCVCVYIITPSWCALHIDCEITGEQNQMVGSLSLKQRGVYKHTLANTMVPRANTEPVKLMWAFNGLRCWPCSTTLRHYFETGSHLLPGGRTLSGCGAHPGSAFHTLTPSFHETSASRPPPRRPAHPIPLGYCNTAWRAYCCDTEGLPWFPPPPRPLRSFLSALISRLWHSESQKTRSRLNSTFRDCSSKDSHQVPLLCSDLHRVPLFLLHHTTTRSGAH